METIKSILSGIARIVAISIGLGLLFAAAPLLCVIVPFWFVLTHPHQSATNLITVYMMVGPFACGFWMTIICHWQTVQKAQAAGVSNWRDAEGGAICTVGKSFGWMVMGWCGSALAEFIFMVVFKHVLHHGVTGRLEYFAVAPFAVFAPALFVTIRRHMANREDAEFTARVAQRVASGQCLTSAPKWGREIDLRHEADQNFLRSMRIETV